MGNTLADGWIDTQTKVLFNLHQKSFQMVYNTQVLLKKQGHGEKQYISQSDL